MAGSGTGTGTSAGRDQNRTSPAPSPSPAPPPSLSSLAQALTAFSSHFRKPSQQQTATATSRRPPNNSENNGDNGDDGLQLPSTQWELAPWKGDEFPHLTTEQLGVIWPGGGEESNEVRTCVARAVEEMELNWTLDSCLLGTRSESNRGNAAIVSLLSRLSLAASRSSAAAKTAAARQSGSSRDATDEEAAAAHTAKHAATSHPATDRPTKTWERYDLLRAIERQDHETILEIRSANFDLLLDSAHTSSSSSHNLTPLGYAISLGPRWQGTAIVLTGALSKFVNSLPDPEDLAVPDVVAGAPARRHLRLEYDPHTMARLRKLRSNLKLAVDHSLALDQTALLASYVQVLFMSEGTPFILDGVASLRTSLRAVLSPRRGSTAVGEIIAPAREESDPVAEAKAKVGQFVTQGLKKRERVAAVGDLVDNAAGDLVLMALWDADAAFDVDPDPELHDPLPPYFFARDDRITQAFLARVEALERWVNDGGGGGGGEGGGEGASAGAGAGGKAGHTHARTMDLRSKMKKSPFYRKALEVGASLRGEGEGDGADPDADADADVDAAQESPLHGEAPVPQGDAHPRTHTKGARQRQRPRARVRLRLESGERLVLLEGCLK